MDRNRHPSVSGTLPTVTTSGNTSGYFTKGDGISVPPTVPTADWANGITEELVNAIQESGQNLSQNTLNQLAIAIGSIGKRKNYIINGNFDFWQRGTSLANGNYTNKYLADRWSTFAFGSTVAVSQQPFTVGQSSVPNNPTYYHRTVVTSVAGANNGSWTSYKLEGVKNLSGQIVTFSIWAKADTAKNIALQIQQYFGSGGSPSSTVSVGVETLNLTTSWQHFSFTVNLPSISGKTLGTNSDDFLQISLWMESGSTNNSNTNNLGQQSGTFDIAQAQLELGSNTTSFEFVNVTEEFDRCRRYYQQYYGSSFRLMGQSATGGTFVGRLGNNLPVKVRVPPTVTMSNIALYDYSTLNTVSSLTANHSTVDILEVDAVVTAGWGGTPGDVRMCQTYNVPSNTSIITIDAEL